MFADYGTLYFLKLFDTSWPSARRMSGFQRQSGSGLANPDTHVAGGVNLVLGGGRSPRLWQWLTLALTVEVRPLMSFY